SHKCNNALKFITLGFMSSEKSQGQNDRERNVVLRNRQMLLNSCKVSPKLAYGYHLSQWS
ncbi:MAG: hypothetical protein PHT77_12655, partial [Bacteroidales bacterium]|nr:hypothetical protein [Bacteroidales bacterium]